MLTLYTTQETAKLLHITRQTLMYRIKKKKIKPADVVGKYKFFTKEEIDRALIWQPKKNKAELRNANIKSAATINNNSAIERSNGAS